MSVQGKYIVPPSRKWFAAFYTQLVKFIPVSECILGGGSIRIRPKDKDSSFLLVLEPRDGAAEGFCFAGGGRWILSYRGSRISAREQDYINKVLHVINLFKEHIPHGLDGYACCLSGQVLEQEASLVLRKMFPFITVEHSASADGAHCEVLLRTSGTCNLDCPFCSAPPVAEPDSDIVAACICETASLLPGATLSLTGGEPALKDSFLFELERALEEEKLGNVQVQTNAIPFARHINPKEIPPDSRLSFFISLHAVDPVIYSQCSGGKADVNDALTGIRRIQEAGHNIVINTVVCSLNLDHLTEIASYLPMPSSGKSSCWHLSALICPEYRKEAEKYLVRYDLLPSVILKASKAAQKRGIRVDSLLSSTHAAVPPCVFFSALPDDRRWLVDKKTDDLYEEEGREKNKNRFSDRLKAPFCKDCSEFERCPGVPASYKKRFGFTGLRPIP